MRRDTLEEGWGFGSRRLALLMTVLAVVSALAFAFVLLGGLRHRTPYSVTVPIDGTGASVGVPALTDGKASEQDAAAADTIAPSPTPRMQTQAPEPSPRSEPRPMAVQRPPQRSEAARRQAQSRPAVVDAAPVAESTPDPSPVAPPSPSPSSAPVRRDPETSVPAPVPAASAVSTARLPQGDQNRNSRVERRDTRREAREAADALRDIRPR